MNTIPVSKLYAENRFNWKMLHYKGGWYNAESMHIAHTHAHSSNSISDACNNASGRQWLFREMNDSTDDRVKSVAARAQILWLSK